MGAFCEMRHPLFKSFLKSIGPLDGSKPGVPDRRLYRIHTLYRDVDGPVLALDTFTNGPDHAPWDDWAKQKPRPATDTRGGRDFLQNQLKAMTLEGTSELQRWFDSCFLTTMWIMASHTSLTCERATDRRCRKNR